MRHLDHELIDVAYLGNLVEVKRLLCLGANVHAFGDSALRCASMNGRTDVVEFLLSAGADVHAWDDGALRFASAVGHVGVMIKLVNAGSRFIILREHWLRLFGHEAPVGLLGMSVEEVKTLLETEAVKRELR